MCIDAKSIPLASWLCLSLVVSYPLCRVTLPYVTLRLENLHCQLQLLGKKMSLEILHGKKKKKITGNFQLIFWNFRDATSPTLP